jgi:hypothetical protein
MMSFDGGYKSTKLKPQINRITSSTMSNILLLRSMGCPLLHSPVTRRRKWRTRRWLKSSSMQIVRSTFTPPLIVWAEEMSRPPQRMMSAVGRRGRLRTEGKVMGLRHFHICLDHSISGPYVLDSSRIALWGRSRKRDDAQEQVMQAVPMSGSCHAWPWRKANER